MQNSWSHSCSGVSLNRNKAAKNGVALETIDISIYQIQNSNRIRKLLFTSLLYPYTGMARVKYTKSNGLVH